MFSLKRYSDLKTPCKNTNFSRVATFSPPSYSKFLNPVKYVNNITKPTLFTKNKSANFYNWTPNNIALPSSPMQEAHATTVLSLRKKGKVVVISDGQVTLGSTIVKNNAKKVRRIGPDGKVLVGFAGAAADALALFERLEGRLESYPGQLLRACVEMAKLWRTDRYLRKLEAVIVVADKDHTLLLTGTGDIQDFQDGLVAIGSGGPYAFASAKALVQTVPDMDVEEIAQKAMKIAADICIYTNSNFSVETLTYDPATSKATV